MFEFCHRNVKIVPDSSLKEALAKDKFDAIILPG